MRRSREDTAETRREAIAVAASLGRTQGWDQVSVGKVMEGAGRTPGAFYRHFASREALLVEACRQTFEDFQRHYVERYGVPKSLAEVVKRYLSRDHRDNPGTGCLIPGLLGSAQRQPLEIGEMFTDAIKDRIKQFDCLSADADRDAQIASVAAMYGALALARSVSDPNLSNELLDATARHLSRVLGERE